MDTYLFLRSGSATSGTALHQNDDIGGTNRNSQIVATLAAGTYTIEATTYSPDTTGSFTLSVAGGGGGRNNPGPPSQNSDTDSDIGLRARERPRLPLFR
ncbi:MAG: hypothetical protein OXC95_15350 [Dehalococcoidia bacterium]|nr:hypothetical protein [Dehalococcoidia bacterium]